MIVVCLFFPFSLPIESLIGKQPQHSAHPLPSAGHPPTATAKKLAMASSGEDAGENGGPQATLLSTVALRRLRMSPSFMQRPDLRAFWQYLRTLAHLSLRLGGTTKEKGEHLAPSRLDQARLALRQLGVAVDRRSLASKELLFLQHKRRAARCLRDDVWRWGIGEVKKTAEQREWGEVPAEVARALVECWRNRSYTRFHMPRLWNLWPLPLQQLEQDWDEVYVDEFSEVSDDFARPRDVRWDSFYADFTKHWLIHPSPYTKSARGLPSLPESTSPLPVCLSPAEQLDVAILALGGRISREPSLERPLPRRKRTPAEALVPLHPEPLRRETRVRKPSRRRLPSPPEIEEQASERLPAPPEAGTDLEQLQQVLARCMDLSKEVTKPYVEWARALLHQIRTELERQRWEQRKAL